VLRFLPPLRKPPYVVGISIILSGRNVKIYSIVILTSGNYLIKAKQTPNQGSASLVSHIPQRNTTKLMKRKADFRFITFIVPSWHTKHRLAS